MSKCLTTFFDTCIILHFLHRAVYFADLISYTQEKPVHVTGVVIVAVTRLTGMHRVWGMLQFLV